MWRWWRINVLKQIFRKDETRPRRFTKPRPATCYKCSMPGLYPCEFPGCTIPMCLKHVNRKAGGKLCDKHKNATLVQHEAKPQTRFRDAGEAVPHVEANAAGVEGPKTDRTD